MNVTGIADCGGLTVTPPAERGSPGSAHPTPSGLTRPGFKCGPAPLPGARHRCAAASQSVRICRPGRHRHEADNADRVVPTGSLGCDE